MCATRWPSYSCMPSAASSASSSSLQARKGSTQAEVRRRPSADSEQGAGAQRLARLAAARTPTGALSAHRPPDVCNHCGELVHHPAAASRNARRHCGLRRRRVARRPPGAAAWQQQQLVRGACLLHCHGPVLRVNRHSDGRGQPGAPPHHRVPLAVLSGGGVWLPPAEVLPVLQCRSEGSKAQALLRCSNATEPCRAQTM